ncbi:MAG: DUF1353 domain-containing protein [Fuerstiella sp.]
MFKSLADGRIQLEQPLYQPIWLSEGVEFRVIVPEGFVSDGASIPRWLWPVLGPPVGNRHLIPAIVHDWLCVRGETYHERVLSDAVFFKLLAEYEVPRWKRTVMYLAVRCYGRFVWRARRASA